MLLKGHPHTIECFRFATTDAAQSQISAGIKYKTEANNRERVRFTYYSGVLVLKGHGTYTTAEGTTYRLGPGDFFQRLPMQVHSTMVALQEAASSAFCRSRSHLALQKMWIRSNAVSSSRTHRSKPGAS